MNTTLVQNALAVTVASQCEAGNMECLNQSRLVASLMLACEGADAEAVQFGLDVAQANQIASGLIHPSPAGPILI